MFLEVSSQSSDECSSTESDESIESQVVFLMVLDGDRKRLLMFETENEWYLPFFEYAYISGRHRAKACLQLQKKLGIEMTRQHLVAEYDAMGHMFTSSMNGSETRAYCNLLVVDNTCSKFVPEHPAAWHGIESVSRLATAPHRTLGPSKCTHESILKVVLEILHGEYPRPHHQDIRYRRGWFQKASNYLSTTIAGEDIPATGPVFQYSHSESSTLLAVNTTRGRYFLKSPAAGCEELKYTNAIAQYLPKCTLHVMGTNEELNCFVSQPLEILEMMDPGDVEDPATAKTVVRTLARMQLASRKHLLSLEDAGIPSRSPTAILRQIQRWLRKDSFVLINFPFALEDVETSLDAISEALMIVHNSGVPLTLVHGDVSESNFGRRKDENGDDIWVLHDWQFASLSHPFFDLHLIYEELSAEAVETYLEHWTEFATAEKLKEVLPVACKLGWFLKAWTAIECVEACCPAYSSLMLEFFSECISETAYRWQKLGLPTNRSSQRESN